ncbi:uncharacterized protein BX663DRAFT_506730 [Cokeromyces recurvatus]|uniref:uncharacterized protein n=1 Tax=Cokeromyces recurvatus TaxID=90255 RepID=UPI00221EEDB2|nr:uncharacterized protein BX663DRAFT_506730 [Cokeromyces recurvatus]KAI7903518.1 hypothetical protein BX663DRAFT_506730 [Cokeromyces recurvatus]
MSTTTNTSSTTKKATQLEITPRVYYEYYMTTKPSYDLYPSLSRRLNNGYVHQPIKSPKKQTDFIVLKASSVHREIMNDPLWQATQQEQNPSWDLYPAILRNVTKKKKDT